MQISRRDFLKATGGLTITAALSAALGRRGLSMDEIHAAVAEYNTVSATAAAAGSTVAASGERIVPTVCLMCPSGCGMWAGRGRPAGQAGGQPAASRQPGDFVPQRPGRPELLYNPDRIRARCAGRRTRRGALGADPLGDGPFTGCAAPRQPSARGHPERFAFLYGETRGQMRDLITRFTQAVGSPNAVSHDSLNIEAAKLGNLLTQGIYDQLAYDLENANYVLSFGSSLLEAGRLAQRFIAGYAYMRRGRPNRGKVVVVDPRQGISGAKADEWIPIRPGTEAALALGMANVLSPPGWSTRISSSTTPSATRTGRTEWRKHRASSRWSWRNTILQTLPRSPECRRARLPAWPASLPPTGRRWR